MKARNIPIIVVFVAGVAGAVIAVAGALRSDPVLRIDFEDDPPPVAAAAPTFGHVKRFLQSIPDTRNLMAPGRGAALPSAPGVSIRHFRGERVVAGTIEVLSGGQTVGLVQAAIEIVPVDAIRFVIHRAWHGPEIVLVCVTVPRLRALAAERLADIAEELTTGEEFFVFDQEGCSEVRIPRDLAPGSHAFSFPSDWADLPEILVLCPSTNEDALNRSHVVRIEPRRRQVTVIAPSKNAFRGFDEAPGPARLFRDPTTGRVVGDGGGRPFVLSEDLNRIETWLE